MHRMRWTACLWPGLPQLALRGSWSGLTVAVGWTVLLDLALLGTLVWTELLPAGLRTALWWLVAGVWLASAGYSGLWCWRHGGDDDGESDAGGFDRAVEHYLKGNWFETERTLVNLLRVNARDADARLMLATLLRRRGRRDEAAAQLDRLEQLENAGKWEWEIGRERQRLQRAAGGPDTDRDEGEQAAPCATADASAAVTRAA